MDGATIRRTFLDYFETRGHTVVRSSPLVPRNDPTLYFANAGMVQFKNVFTGNETRDYQRATSVQKCLRVSGKQNDLENVGVTPRHHTFFEMLGNFSFGDYFKADAIAFAWELLTDVYRLDADKLWVTVYREDNEAYELWRDKVGVLESKIVRMGEKDNFWAMGDTGPCGPCSEIHLDVQAHAGRQPNMAGPEDDPEGYLEIWNLVFMQYERHDDGSLAPLPRPAIDTGMGLERLASILQNKLSNYDTDLFEPLIAKVSELCGVRYRDHTDADISMRVVSDHARATAFLIGDGIVPSNEERGYVLRRIMRRAIRHGVKLGLNEPFLFKMVQVTTAMMGSAFPELAERQNYLLEVVLNEEERFSETLDKGLKLYREQADRLKQENKRLLPGDFAFRLSDTYGFPLDLTELIAAEDGLVVDQAGYQEHMARQRERARQAWKGSGEEAVADTYQSLRSNGLGSEFVGYDRTVEISPITALLVSGKPVKQVSTGDEVEVVTRQTPFYGESGGQVGDTGRIDLLVEHADGVALQFDALKLHTSIRDEPRDQTSEDDLVARLRSIFGHQDIQTNSASDQHFASQLSSKVIQVRVSDTQSPAEGLVIHRGKVVAGEFGVGDWVRLAVDKGRRNAIRRNHTATHLAHAGLREVLGPHVAQRGSLVAPDRMRFDFLHFKPMSDDEITAVEDWVNEAIMANQAVQVDQKPLEEAIASGVVALFGERYGDRVRVVKIPGFSAELCGGTHVSRTGDLGLFKIVSESGIQAGVRRIEATTGFVVLELMRQHETILKETAAVLKVGVAQVADRTARLIEDRRESEKQIEALKKKIAMGLAGPSLEASTQEVGGVKVLSLEVEAGSPKALREQADRLRDKLKSGVVCLGTKMDDKVSLLVAVTPDLTERFSAGEIIKEIAKVIEGRGGGRRDLAQAGGKAVERLDEALDRVREVVRKIAG